MKRPVKQLAIGAIACAMALQAGVHTRIDHEAGLHLGHEVAVFVPQNAPSTDKRDQERTSSQWLGTS